jgi:phosphate/sulfate permease
MVTISIFLSIIATVISGAISVAIAFYIKDSLKKRNQYKSLKQKLEEIAGKNAEILYSGPPGIFGPQKYKIFDISSSGLMLKNKMCDVFIPIEKALETDTFLPGENYETVRQKYLENEMKTIMKSMVPSMIEELVPAVKEVMVKELMTDSSNVTMAIGVQVQKLLETEGFSIQKKEIASNKKRPNSFSELEI